MSLILVGVAVVLAAAFESLVSSSNLTLFFVLPVVISATSFGWAPALTASIAGVLAFDFFFTEPRFSFAIYSPADICDAILLLVIAGIVSTVAAESRRKAFEANRAAEAAEVLRGLAHEVIEAPTTRDFAQATAAALNRIFGAPAAIFTDDQQGFRLIARTGPGLMEAPDDDAARAAAAAHVPTRAEAYPNENARYDFWPVSAGAGRTLVIGVDFISAHRERPKAAERYVEIVGGYLAAAFGRHAAPDAR